MIYNFPGVAAGIDVNSEMFAKLGSHENIVGVKLTCGGIAKVARIKAQYEPAQFAAIAGQSDWLLPGMSVGAIGSVTGVGNLYPRVSRTTKKAPSSNGMHMLLRASASLHGTNQVSCARVVI